MNLTAASPRKWTKGCSFAWVIVSQVWVIPPLKGIWMCFADKHTKSTEPGVKGYHRKKELKTKKKHKQINKKKQNNTKTPLWDRISILQTVCWQHSALAGGFKDIASSLPLRSDL